MATFALPVPAVTDQISAISDIEKCRPLVADAERLLCYDTIADGGVFTQQQLQQARVENFGDPKEPEADPDTLDQLVVTVVRVTKSETGVHYFYTADGQVWKQSGRGNWNLEVPFEASIETGVMGSYFLQTDDGKSARVSRVR